MKVSVVMPVHNKAPFLERTLRGILGSTFTGAMEVIAVEDASTDNSYSILRSIDDPRLRIIKLERNVGPGMAAQVAHDHATGEYILRVDADDVQHPQRVAEQVAFMDAHPELLASGTYLKLLGTDQVRKKPLADAQCQVELLFGVAIQQPTMIVRRRVLQERELRYQEHWPWYGEDRLFQLELSRWGKLANLPQALVEYRPGGISSVRRREDLQQLEDMVFDRLGMDRPTSEQLEFHRMSVQQFLGPVTPQKIWGFKAWLNELIDRNRHVERFPPEALRERIGSAWNDVFYHLPRFGAGVVLAYWRAGGRMDIGRLYYAFRSLRRMPSAERST